MKCKNCNCPTIEAGFCDLCEIELIEAEQAEIEEHEDQLEKARKAGVPLDILEETVRLIHFE